MNIYNVIILDESGSMSSIYNETIVSMNEVLSGIRKNQKEYPEQHHFVTFVTFEGNGIAGVKVRRDRVPIDAVEDITTKDYRPGGCTPLYDAMGKTLNKMEGLVRDDERVVVTVITDGMENSSTEYSGKTVKTMVERLREKGWILGYIGANQDSVEVAKDLSIDNAVDFCACPEGTVYVARKMRRAHSNTAMLFSLCADTNEMAKYNKLFEDDEDKDKK